MRLPGAVNHSHPAPGDLLHDFVIGDAPIPIPGFYGGQRFLERFRARRAGFVLKRPVQQAMQTKTVGKPRP